MVLSDSWLPWIEQHHKQQTWTLRCRLWSHQSQMATIFLSCGGSFALHPTTTTSAYQPVVKGECGISAGRSVRGPSGAEFHIQQCYALRNSIESYKFF